MAEHRYQCSLNAEQRARLRDILAAGNYLPLAAPHAEAAARGRDCSIMLYRTGTCVVQGRGASDWVAFVLEPLVLKGSLPDPARTSLDDFQPHLGVDESGKGDYFGPLVIAAVYLEKKSAETLVQDGVRDSKRIAGRKTLRTLAARIRACTRGAWSVVPIGPEAYNRMIADLGNVNRVLAWGHARAIENVLDRVPSCTLAVADQFGPEYRIQRALLEKGRRITLQQRVRAESDPAVAAASILARDVFLERLEALGKRFQMEFPRGCSPAVVTAAAELVRRHGPAVLPQTVKLHFRTTQQVHRARTDESSTGRTAEGTAQGGHE